MKTSLKILLISLILMLAGCPGYENKSDKLTKTLREFHTLLKFKEFLRASEYIVPFYHKEFMDRFASGKVMIEDFEVRGLETDSKNLDKMEVTVRLLLRPNRSMTVKTITMVERWTYTKMSWKLTNIHKLSEVKHKPGNL